MDMVLVEELLAEGFDRESLEDIGEEMFGFFKDYGRSFVIKFMVYLYIFL